MLTSVPKKLIKILYVMISTMNTKVFKLRSITLVYFSSHPISKNSFVYPKYTKTFGFVLFIKLVNGV